MIPALLARVAPIWPVNGTEGPATGGALWPWIALGLALAVAVGGAVSYFGWRDRRRHTPEQRAFRALARRLRIGRRARAAVEDLARAAGLPPVALLISEHAYRGALGSRAEPEALARLVSRVFAER